MLSPDEAERLQQLKRFTLGHVRQHGRVLSHPLVAKLRGVNLVNEAFAERAALLEHLWWLIRMVQREAGLPVAEEAFAAEAIMESGDTALMRLANVAESLAAQLASVASSPATLRSVHVRESSLALAAQALAYIEEARAGRG